MDTTLEVLTTRRRRRGGSSPMAGRHQGQDRIGEPASGRDGGRGRGTPRAECNHLSSWRTLARQVKLVLPEPEDAVEFAPMVIEVPAPELSTAKAVSRAEIVIGPVTIRLEEGASAARIAAIARALAAET